MAHHTIRVLLADDDRDLTTVVRAVLEHEEDLEVVGAADNTDDCIRLAIELRPSIALIDAHMPGGGGGRACRELRRNAPETAILAYSGSGDIPLIINMLREGAVGYVIKGTRPNNLTEAIRRAARGEGTLPTEVAGAVLGELRRSAVIDERRAEEMHGATLDDIIENRKLALEFQPIFDLDSGRVVGAEALSRFPGAPPDVWFDRAWALSRGAELEVLAVEKALDALDAIPGDVYLSINISARTVTHPRLLEALERARGRDVMLEITEQARIEEPGFFSRDLANIRDLGVRIAADDVGAGFANFVHITHLAPDCLKFDRALINDIHREPMQQAMTRSLIEFANAIGASCLAEGIESADEITALRELGVRYGQGFHLGRPGPLPLPRTNA